MTLIEVAITSLILLYGLLLTLCTIGEQEIDGAVQQHDSPENLSPGALGCFAKGDIDFELIAADLFYLQNHGYILIETESKTYKILQLKPVDDSLPSYLKELLHNLFAEDDIFILGKFNQKRFNQIADSAWQSYQRKVKSFYEPNFFIMALVMLLAGLALILPCVAVIRESMHFVERTLVLALGATIYGLIQHYRIMRHIPFLQYSNRQIVFKLLLLAITSTVLLHQSGFDEINYLIIVLSTLGGVKYFSFAYKHLNRRGRKLSKRLNGYREYLLNPDPERAYLSHNEIKIDFIDKAPYAFVLAQEYPLINTYSQLSDNLKLAENNYQFFEKHFKAYLKLTHCLESVYYRKVMTNKLLEFSW